MIETHLYYLTAVMLFVIGLFTIVASNHLIKIVIGLNLTQIGVYLFIVSVGYIDGASPPIIGFGEPYANPLLHVVVLTAIVVGVAITALALALTIRLYEEFGTLNVNEIEAALAADEDEGGS